MDLPGVQVLELLAVLAGVLAVAGALAALMVRAADQAQPKPQLQRVTVRVAPREAPPHPVETLLQAPERAPPFRLRRCTRADQSICRE